MATEPKIYTKNYLDSYSTITPTSGSGTKARLFDRDRDVQWSTSGEGTDGTGISIIAQLNTPSGVASAKAIDTVMFLNHNMSDILIQTSADGVNYSNRQSGVGATNNVFSIASVTAAWWRTYCANTSPSNAEKKIGEIVYCSLLVDPGVELDSYEVNYRQMAPEVPLADGSVHRTVIKWTESRSAKYECSARMSYLTYTQLETLRALKETGAPFLWQPESVTRPQEVYYVNWTGPFRWRYMSGYKGSGFQVELQLKEV